MGESSKTYKWLFAAGGQIKRLWAFLKELGLTGATASAIVMGAVAVIAWLYDKLPLSVICVLALLAFALFANGYHQFVWASRISRFDPKKSAELGRQLSQFSRTAFRTLSEWERRNPRPPRNEQDLHADWQLDRDREQARSLEFQEQHMAQAVALIVTLHGLGISPPFQAVAGAESRPSALISYLGAVGHLLEAGLIEEARAMNDERADSRALPFHLLS